MKLHQAPGWLTKHAAVNLWKKLLEIFITESYLRLKFQ